MLRLRIVGGTIAIALYSAAALSAQESAPAGLDAFVAQVMRRFDVPGIALTIVKDGKVVLARGYGVRELGKPAPVDSQTTFGIASNTKAFTATAIGMLVEEGKLQWDAPVVRYLPAFALSDPYVTSQLTVRDLLVHRSGLGLGAGDLLWWPTSTYDRREIMRRLRYIPLATSFRSAYAYDNVLYLVAGELIEAVSGKNWEDFVQSRILTPLNMTDSRVRHSAAAGAGNIATTHAPIDGVVRPIAPFTSDNTNPAGGVNASARDMAKWLIVQLDSGRTGVSTRLFAAATTRQLWTMVTPMPIGGGGPVSIRPNFLGYALGVQVQDYRGHKFVTHTGGLPGYVSMVSLIPDMKLGVSVLTNQESGAAFQTISYWILDQFLHATDVDWVAMIQPPTTTGAKPQPVGPGALARDSLSKPSLPLAAYACTYTDPWYGDVSIKLEDGKLVMRMLHTPGLTGDLEHWQHDTFVARWHDREMRADAFVIFSLNPDNSIDQVKMRKFLNSTDFSFDFQDLLLKRTASNRPCDEATTR
jgi:CubicO group peptidase (beta-lactamase class C family)